MDIINSFSGPESRELIFVVGFAACAAIYIAYKASRLAWRGCVAFWRWLGESDRSTKEIARLKHNEKALLAHIDKLEIEKAALNGRIDGYEQMERAPLRVHLPVFDARSDTEYKIVNREIQREFGDPRSVLRVGFADQIVRGPGGFGPIGAAAGGSVPYKPSATKIDPVTGQRT